MLWTIANPESSSEVVAVAFSFALLICNRRQDKPTLLPSTGIKCPSPTCERETVKVN